MEKTKVALPYRYPGSQPFQRDQQRIFFGRDQDKTNLFRTVSVNDLTVLYGESGLGKSSLLNAGVIPEFTKQGVTTIPLRFYAYNKRAPVNPLQNILGQLRPFASEDPAATLPDSDEAVFMSSVQGDPAKQSLWQQVKSILWRLREGRAGVILVLDQFEEIFTYPRDLIEEFSREFAELLDNRMPETFRQRFYEMLEKGEQEPGTPDELAFLEKSPPLKVVLGIRFDKLGLLKQIAQFYPNILLNQNLFRLQPLTREQAKEAIERPATEDGDFATPKFQYAPEALDAILDYLTDDNTKSVETTQLQVICQYVEKTIIKPKVQGQAVQREQLGDIRLIFQNYYDNIVASLPEAEQPKVRNLVEKGLIFEPELRLSLYGEQIEKVYGVLPETLEVLVGKHHLLRVEERSGGFVYEISHDSLVPPILASKNIREAEIARVQREAEEARLLAEAEEKDRQERAAREEAERQQRLRRRNQANFWFGVIAGTLALAALIFGTQAFIQRRRADAATKEAQEQRQQAVENYKIAQLQRDSALLLKSELEETQRQFISETFKRRYEQGKLLIDQKKYSDALVNLEEALQINAPERNPAELRNLIATCKAGIPKEKRFSELTRRGDELRDQKQNYLGAYPLYEEALQLNFDNQSAQQKLDFCKRMLLNQLQEELRRADTFQKEGKNCDDAQQTVRDYVDPILSTLKLPPTDYLRIKRDKIWKACR